MSRLKVGLYLLMVPEGKYVLFACMMIVLKCNTAASVFVWSVIQKDCSLSSIVAL